MKRKSWNCASNVKRNWLEAVATAQIEGELLQISFAGRRAGLSRFAGGMSTEKYTAITGVSRATAYRELTQLAGAGLLERSGQGRGTRYALVPLNPSRI